jgi:FKBP-type peptidyl-prolyl cis-trans isomerase FklB
MQLKKIILPLLLLTITFVAAAQTGQTKSKTSSNTKPVTVAGPGLKTLKDSASYALGYNVGQNLSQRYSEMELEIIIKGMKDAFTNKPSVIPAENSSAAVNQFLQEVKQQKAAANKAAGAKFLKENAQKPGVVTTASGLQYTILKQGDGAKPTAGSTVSVHYFGTLLNGKEFDNSYKRGQPAQFGVGGVIAGWTEALQLMPVGSKYKLFIPANLAYGDNEMGANIPAGSTLIFEVELLSIVN